MSLSPGTELYLLINRLNIAADGAELDFSLAAMVSFGGNAELSMPLGSHWSAKAQIRSTILSFAFRAIETHDGEVVPVAVLTPLKGFHGTVYLGIHRRLGQHASAKVGYLVDITRITKWNPVLSVSDLFTIGVSYEY